MRKVDLDTDYVFVVWSFGSGLGLIFVMWIADSDWIGHKLGLANLHRLVELVDISCFFWTTLFLIFILCTPRFDGVCCGSWRGSAVGHGVTDLVTNVLPNV